MLLWCTKRIFGCIQRAQDECDAMNKKYTWTYTRGAYKYILGYVYKRCMLLHFVRSISSLVFTYLRSPAGLYKLFHPAIPDGRTWSKFGEHGQDGDHDPGTAQNGKTSTEM